MKEMTVTSWDDFTEITSDHKYREWLYRGHGDTTWKLESSLFRAITKNIKLRAIGKKGKVLINREKYEAEMIKNFKQTAHLFLQHMPDKTNDFDWLSIMQHYGAPTRLLDFSFSPWVALFFAISEIRETASVYCIKYKDIKIIDEKFYDDINDRYLNLMKTNNIMKDTILIPYEPEFKNNRLMAQQGAFLIPNTLKYSHDEILSNYKNDDFVIKINIPESIVVEAIENLQKMNMTYLNMYQGIEGLCKSYSNIGIIPINRFRPINKKEDA